METDERQTYKVMSTLHNLFSSKPSVKKLMGLQRNLPEEQERYVEKAIEHLVKKLKKRDIVELEKAISYPGVPTNCVTIPRSMDGRLQVANRKGLPHVIYCRLWRWADLQSPHELRPLKCCKYPFSKRDKDVCVNPYHYERVDLSVTVPRRPKEMVPKTIERNDGAPWLPLSVVEVNSRVEQSMQCQFVPTMTLECHEYNPGANCGYNEFQNYGNSCDANPVESIRVAYPDDSNWATLAYYELNARVGEIFHCTQNDISVDGGTAPNIDGSRFCLNRLCQVNRNPASEKVLRNIGKGITLRYTHGEVFLDNLDNYSVYVQSWLGNWLNNMNDTSVIKVPGQNTIKIFDLHKFFSVLQDRVKYGYEPVYELAKMCTIRMSFVKGWGADYQRHEITSTPCWIEIHLISPLKWLDNVLKELPTPNNISSVS